MENQIYQDPIMMEYRNLIEPLGIYKRIYLGDPIRIGNSELPALIIAKVDTRAGQITNSEDQQEMRMTFTVVTDVRDTISEDKEMVRGVNSLYDLLEGRDSATFELKPTSLLYVLRHNQVVNAARNLRTDLQSVSKIDYGMTIGKRKDEAWSIEGTLEITATFTQVR